MTPQFDSKAERAVTQAIAILGGVRCDDFEPYLPRSYRDASDAELEGKPDILIRRGTQFTFIEVKAGRLNSHYTLESSHAELASEYRHFVRRCPDGLSHSALSSALFNHPNRHAQQASRDHAFNHSLFKVAALQAKHGWQRYVVVFKANPHKRDAERYARAGLIFCTEKTLPDLMLTVELAQKGFLIPFEFKGPGYKIAIVPESGTGDPIQAEAIDRSRFLAGVEADKQAVAEAYKPPFEDGEPY